MSEFEALKEVVQWLWKCHAELVPDEDHDKHPQLGSQQYQFYKLFFGGTSLV